MKRLSSVSTEPIALIASRGRHRLGQFVGRVSNDHLVSSVPRKTPIERLLLPQPQDIPIPGILGIAFGVVIGLMIFRTGKESSLKRLMVFFTILLLFIAGELSSNGKYSTQALL